MSLEKQLCFIQKKYLELIKSAEMFERYEIIERCVCKRSIRRNNRLAASKSARKCVELHYKSRVYAVTGRRIKNFLESVNNTVTIGQHNKIKDLKPLVSNIERGLAVMSFDLLDLYLDSFENSLVNGKRQEEEDKDSLLKVSSIQLDGSQPSENDSNHTRRVNRKQKVDKEKLEDENKKKEVKSFQNSLQMYKLVPDDEVDRLMAELAEEVKAEDLAFLFEKPQQSV